MREATIHAYRDKETNRGVGEALGLTGPAMNYFMYACQEVKLDLEVNEETGEAKIVKVNGRTVSD